MEKNGKSLKKTTEIFKKYCKKHSKYFYVSLRSRKRKIIEYFSGFIKSHQKSSIIFEIESRSLRIIKMSLKFIENPSFSYFLIVKPQNLHHPPNHRSQSNSLSFERKAITCASSARYRLSSENSIVVPVSNPFSCLWQTKIPNKNKKKKAPEKNSLWLHLLFVRAPARPSCLFCVINNFIIALRVRQFAQEKWNMICLVSFRFVFFFSMIVAPAENQQR